MADKGKAKLPPEESSSSTRRHRRDTAGAQVSASARTEHVPQVSMSAEEQEQEDLFQAQLLSMVGTFQELVKNPRMQKFLKSKKEDSQAESSQHAVKRKQEQIPEKLEHAEKTPIVAAGPVQEATLAQDPAVNGQGSNAQQVLPTISPLTAAQPGYFGGGSIFQAMAR